MPVLLSPLGPEHATEVLAGQDAELAREVVGTWWDRASLATFCERASRWSADGPIRELVARDEEGALVGGGGLHRLGAGLERGQADVTYWVLAAHRGRGLGHAIAGALLDLARGDPRNEVAVLRIAPENAASRAVARRLGAAPTGALERHPGDALRAVERWELVLR